MEARIFAYSKGAHLPEEFNGDLYDEWELLSGQAAGMCYLSGEFTNVQDEPIEKSFKRALTCKASGHHSVFDHMMVTVELSGISKILAMVLNNLKAYNTSEKSGRYTKMSSTSEKEQKIYSRWVDLLTEEIIKLAKEEGWTGTEESIHKEATKLAQENARYFIGIHQPIVHMLYTASLRRWSYICHYMKDFIEGYGRHLADANSEEFPICKGGPDNSYLLKWSDYLDPIVNEMKIFIGKIKNLGLYDEKLKDEKLNKISLFTDRSEYFSPINNQPYLFRVTSVDGIIVARFSASFASCAQLQRHRTIDFKFSLGHPIYDYNGDEDDILRLYNLPPFIPPIVERTKTDGQTDKQTLYDLWINDMGELRKDKVICAGDKILVKMTASYEAFFNMCLERLCGRAQLETQKIVQMIFNSMYSGNEGFKQFVCERTSNCGQDLDKQYFRKCNIQNCNNPCHYRAKDFDSRLI